MATEAHLVPLVRMSTTVFAAGTRAPEDHHRRSTKGTTLWGTGIPPSRIRGKIRISARRCTRSATVRSTTVPGRRHHGGHQDLPDEGGAVGGLSGSSPSPIAEKAADAGRTVGNGGPTLRSRARLTGPRVESRHMVSLATLNALPRKAALPAPTEGHPGSGGVRDQQ